MKMSCKCINICKVWEKSQIFARKKKKKYSEIQHISLIFAGSPIFASFFLSWNVRLNYLRVQKKRVRPLRLPGRRALAQLASTYISAACLIFMGIGQGVVALLWREWGAFEANVLANVDVILKYDNSQIWWEDYSQIFASITRGYSQIMKKNSQICWFTRKYDIFASICK